MANRGDIPIGRINAISRAALCSLWRCPDRMVRRKIAELRAQPSDDGLAILSSAHEPAGYWRSTDPAELRAFVRENEARARNTFIAVKSARRLLEQQGQIDIDSIPPSSGSGGRW